jgi:hypothetical protein
VIDQRGAAPKCSSYRPCAKPATVQNEAPSAVVFGRNILEEKNIRWLRRLRRQTSKQRVSFPSYLRIYNRDTDLKKPP